MTSRKTFIVEHLDPELGPWSELEYLTIGKESKATGSKFILSSLPTGFKVPSALEANDAFAAEERGVEELYASDKSRVCLLDPSASKDLSPEDGDVFDAFLFGGILEWPQDRTSELRKKGFEGRRLGPKQMTTDTAVRVTRIVVQDKGWSSPPRGCGKGCPIRGRRDRGADVIATVALDKVPYVDFPELRFNEHESTEMPFRYVTDENGQPIMPDGMKELIEKDADKAVDDLF
ncbi:Rps3 or RNA methylase involved in ribosome biogenesis, SPOUT family [Geosmithia morbida]|uniref:Rps3 or RNA methylase involved in ribosome biogenesis, SPOUT family n=1 Tax=Geosmithia morbida TaxID=1094350 RepID=A0A9P5D2R8_9HYPO|nr:Rps3 or RNA methylase involved in ribosome biogenesis, SPOUT family [Geosmithia morbida]KAF4121085.1 Rps3 or RNA methylase involved in ribosome biogenesis, SPOUT family [Geosmithia morbida]